MVSYTEPYAQYVGRKIREARVAAGLSHDRLAAKAGLPESGGRQHLIKLEQGRHLPRPETLEKIAAATERPMGFFLPAISEPRSARVRRYHKIKQQLEAAA